jgi:hypothetical protein
MFITFLIIFVLSICYLTFFYNEHAECEEERQALIASIEKLRTMPRGTFTKDNNTQNPPKKLGRPKKS